MSPPPHNSNPDPPDGLERVQKVLSRSGVASRRQSEELIRQGRIEVNGQPVTLGARMRPGEDVLRFDGEVVRISPRPIVLLVNKPTGTLCSESDPEGRPLVHHIMPRNLALRLVGRLDFNTEGVLLLTNDGELGNRLSHPRHGVLRVYEARVRGLPDAATLQRLVRGVTLEDGPARVESARIVKQTDRNAWVQLTLTEGRNREVRRLMERVGHPVMRLRRVRFAGLGIGALKPGQWRALTDEEVEELRSRGHVGAFSLPPDPRRSAQKRRKPNQKKPAASGSSKRRGDRSVGSQARKSGHGAAGGRARTSERDQRAGRKPRGKGKKR